MISSTQLLEQAGFVPEWNKAANRGLLSHLDDFEQDIIMRGAVRCDRQSLEVVTPKANRECTVNNNGSSDLANE